MTVTKWIELVFLVVVIVELLPLLIPLLEFVWLLLECLWELPGTISYRIFLWKIRTKERVYDKSLYRYMTGIPAHKARMDKGTWGEYLCYNQLRRFAGDGARFLFNVYLPKADGTSSEIDLLMIHPTGLYVLESKNYSGLLKGDANAYYWDKCIGRKQYPVYNPLRQNEGHCKAIRELIGTDIPMFPVTVLNCRYKIQNADNKAIVCRLRNLKRTAKKLCSGKEVFSPLAIDALYRVFLPCANASEETKRYHREFVKRCRNQAG